MKSLMLSLLILFTLVGCQNSPSNDLAIDLANHTNALITIEVVSLNDGYYTSHSGMGFMFAKDELDCYVVTANHVVEQPYSFMAYKHWNTNEKNEKNEKIKYIGSDKNTDLAVLKLPISNNNCTTVSVNNQESTIRLGESVLIFGHPPIKYNDMPTKFYKSVSNGVISTVLDNYNKRGFSVIASTGVVSPGFSGGAVFSISSATHSVEFIGMAVESLRQVENNGVAMPLSIIIPAKVLQESANKIIATYKETQEEIQEEVQKSFSKKLLREEAL